MYQNQVRVLPRVVTESITNRTKKDFTRDALGDMWMIHHVISSNNWTICTLCMIVTMNFEDLGVRGDRTAKIIVSTKKIDAVNDWMSFFLRVLFFSIVYSQTDHDPIVTEIYRHKYLSRLRGQSWKSRRALQSQALKSFSWFDRSCPLSHFKHVEDSLKMTHRITVDIIPIDPIAKWVNSWLFLTKWSERRRPIFSWKCPEILVCSYSNQCHLKVAPLMTIRHNCIGTAIPVIRGRTSLRNNKLESFARISLSVFNDKDRRCLQQVVQSCAVWHKSQTDLRSANMCFVNSGSTWWSSCSCALSEKNEFLVFVKYDSFAILSAFRRVIKITIFRAWPRVDTYCV